MPRGNVRAPAKGHTDDRPKAPKEGTWEERAVRVHAFHQTRNFTGPDTGEKGQGTGEAQPA